MPVFALQYIQGGNQSAQIGNVFTDQVVVRAIDSAGNPVAGEPLIWATALSEPTGTFVNTGNGFFTGPTDANGYGFAEHIRASSHAGAWLGGVQVVEQPTISTTYSMTNTPVGPNSVAITQGNAQKAAQNSAYGPISATVRDGSNAPFPGATVQFSVPAGHGTFPGALTTVTAVTDSTGVATAPTFTANAVLGGFTVTVSVPAAPTVPNATTTWTTVDPAVPTTVQAISGGGQQAAVSALFAKPLKAKVVNALGAPVSGVTVTLTSPASGASCTFPAIVTFSTVTAVTDANGEALSPVPLANAIAGSYFVTATVPGATAAQFQLTNGSSYQPEVCTTSAAPQGAVNQGAQTQTWANPVNAINGNTTGAVVTMLPSTASQILLASPAAAGAFGPILDDAKVTKFVFTYDARSNRAAASNYAFASARLFDGTSGRSSTINNAGGIGGNTWESKTQTISAFSSPTSISGAQLKAGNFGMGFFVNADGTQDGTVSIRNVKMSVCYQNPNTPPAALAVPLQLCEV